MLNVLATARDVPPHAEPAAGCVVHQPANVYPVFANVPVLPATVTVALNAYVDESVGTEPEPCVFPLYVTENGGNPNARIGRTG